MFVRAAAEIDPVPLGSSAASCRISAGCDISRSTERMGTRGILLDTAAMSRSSRACGSDRSGRQPGPYVEKARTAYHCCHACPISIREPEICKEEPWACSTGRRRSSLGRRAASRRATAELLSEHEARVLVNDLDGDIAERAANEIEGETAVFAGDLTVESAPERSSRPRWRRSGRSTSS